METKDTLDIFNKQGCILKMIKGSHHVLKSCFNNKIFIVPVHAKCIDKPMFAWPTVTE